MTPDAPTTTCTNMAKVILKTVITWDHEGESMCLHEVHPENLIQWTEKSIEPVMEGESSTYLITMSCLTDNWSAFSGNWNRTLNTLLSMIRSWRTRGFVKLNKVLWVHDGNQVYCSPHHGVLWQDKAPQSSGLPTKPQLNWMDHCSIIVSIRV